MFFLFFSYFGPEARNPRLLAGGQGNPITSLNKEVRPFVLGDNSIWSFPLWFFS